MNKHIVRFPLLALLLTACVPIRSTSVNPAQSLTTTPPALSISEASTPSLLIPVERVIINSASYTVTVDDPAQAMTELQHAVEKAGGFVVSASSWSGEDSSNYSSMSAKVSPESLPALREAVHKFAAKIQNQSFYVQDITSDYRKLQKRYQDLIRAQEQTWLFLTQTNDHRQDSTYRLLRELLDNEMESVEYQLVSFEEQSRLATIDITFNQVEQLIVPIE